MGRVLQKQIYTVFIAFINVFRRFSTQRVENLSYVYHGRIIEPYYRYMMKQPASGMKRKPMNRHGVYAHYRETLIHSIITGYYNQKIKDLWNVKCRKKPVSISRINWSL